MSEEPDRTIWKKLAADTKSDEDASEVELPKAEDLVEGPLPETEDVAAERQRKIEAAQQAEAIKRAEEARRLAEIQREEEDLRRRDEEARKHIEEEARKHREEEDRKRRDEEARVAAEKAKAAAEEAKRIAETRTEEHKPVAPPIEESTSAPETKNLLLLGLVNLLQPALDLKLEKKLYQRWIKGWDKIVEVHIIDEGYMHVQIKDNQMKASLGKAPREPDIALEGEYETITNYLNGELDPVLLFFDFILLRKARIVKGLEIKLSSLLSGGLFKQARDLYRIDKILKIK